MIVEFKKSNDGPIESMDLAEFEQRVVQGEINPNHLVRISLITGHQFLPAKELELYRGLHQYDEINFRRNFHLGRVPIVTCATILLMVWAHTSSQTSVLSSTDNLLERGAKSLPLMIELGQWWRLLTANFIHVSTWHLVANTIFLFNIGGPAEAVFRRTDYVLLLIASALGSTLLSTLMTPMVSCGGSGIVFGLWGAVAMFGMRHRRILPKRYRNYFIGSVAPYALFALYQGLAMPDVDNWAHLGGLVTGALSALALPARLLAPQDRRRHTKAVALCLGAATLAIACLYPLGVGRLRDDLYYPRNGLIIPIPNRWSMLSEQRDHRTESYAYHNQAGTVIAFETHRAKYPIKLATFLHTFVNSALPDQLNLHQAEAFKLSEPEDTRVAGKPAIHLYTFIKTPTLAVRMDIYLLTRGYYQYVLSFSSPTWLTAFYRPHFERVLNGVQIVAPDTLRTAQRDSERAQTPASQANLGRALALIGQTDEAWSILRQATKKWPKSGEPLVEQSRLHYELGPRDSHACELVRHALRYQMWTPELLILAIDLHQDCNELPMASRILTAALKRFPKHSLVSNYTLPTPRPHLAP